MGHHSCSASGWRRSCHWEETVHYVAIVKIWVLLNNYFEVCFLHVTYLYQQNKSWGFWYGLEPRRLDSWAGAGSSLFKQILSPCRQCGITLGSPGATSQSLYCKQTPHCPRTSGDTGTLKSSKELSIHRIIICHHVDTEYSGKAKIQSGKHITPEKNRKEYQMGQHNSPNG